jgi:hypothetical protein
MVAHILAGGFIDDDIEQRDNGPNGTAEQSAAADAGHGVYGVAGPISVKVGNKGDELQGIDDVEKIHKSETIVPKRLKARTGPALAGPWRCQRLNVGQLIFQAVQ